MTHSDNEEDEPETLVLYRWGTRKEAEKRELLKRRLGRAKGADYDPFEDR